MDVRVGNRHYELAEKLGKGGLSVVHRGICSKSGLSVALKITPHSKLISEYGQQWKTVVANEVRICKDLRHENLISLLGYDCRAMNDKALIFVQEIAHHGELFDYVKSNEHFGERAVVSMFRQIMAGLKELHSKGIAHRDIKLENLLVGEDFKIKLADFSFCTQFKKFKKIYDGAKDHNYADTKILVKRQIMDTRLGTVGYMAPEIGKGKYNEKVDIYAAGVVLFILIARFPPFARASTADWWFNKIKEKKFDRFWMAHERNVDFSQEAKTLIQGMLAFDPTERYSLQQVLESPFLIQLESMPQEELKKLLLNIKNTNLNKTFQFEQDPQKKRQNSEQKQQNLSRLNQIPTTTATVGEMCLHPTTTPATMTKPPPTQHPHQKRTPLLLINNIVN